MKRSIFTLFSSAILLFLFSCQKDASDPQQPTPPPVIPPDTTVTFLPSSISYVSADAPEENATANFVYSQSDRTIKVNISYPQSTSIYEDVGTITYYYTDQGYLQKRIENYQSGKLFESFEVERDNSNTLNRVLLDKGDPTNYKDTFNFSFKDSATSYKIMTVNSSFRFPSVGLDFKTTDEFTFSNQNITKQKGWSYSDNTADVGKSGSVQSYDAFNRLISFTDSPANGYSEFYSYDGYSKGLDSFYTILGGKDGGYLSTFEHWPAYLDGHGFYFYPLIVDLYGQYDFVDGLMHRYGVLAEKRSTNNLVFTFQNKLDNSDRIVETKIMKQGTLFGTYTITY